LSAISAHAFDEGIIDRPSLKRYFERSLADEKEDLSRTVLALYGLTAFDEPVLIKLQKIKTDKGLTLKDKIFVALSLDAVGAKEEARAYYEQTIKPSVEIKDSYAYVSGLKGDSGIIATTLVTALTTSLGESEYVKFLMYLENNAPSETLNNFERILYLKAALPRLNADAVSFTYRIGDRTETKTLKNDETFSLTLSSQDLAALELSGVKGPLGVVATYEKSSTPASIIKDKNLTLTRNYFVNGVNTAVFNQGDLVLVRLVPKFAATALNGTYQIVDYLPSGLRAVDREANRYQKNDSARIYPAEVNDQKVTFILDKGSVLPAHYFARVVTSGVYKAEPAILQSLRSLNVITISNEASITIR
jgi:hypothetical protein